MEYDAKSDRRDVRKMLRFILRLVVVLAIAAIVVLAIRAPGWSPSLAGSGVALLVIGIVLLIVPRFWPPARRG